MDGKLACLALIFSTIFSGSSWAQADQCAPFLVPRADMAVARLQCTIQILDVARWQALEDLTQSRVNEQVARAKIGELQAEIGRLEEKLRPKPSPASRSPALPSGF